MKKLLLVIFLLVAGRAAYAQTGALQITNSSACTMYVNMWGVDMSSGNGSAGDLAGCLMIIPSGSTIYTFASVAAYATSTTPPPGWCGEATPVCMPCWGTTTMFKWTDVQFQFNCPSADCSGGGNMTSPSATTCLFCTGASWSPTVCGPSATWTETPGPYMNDVVISF